MNDWNILSNENINTNRKSRAIVLRCSDQTYNDLMQLIKTLPECYIVFSKSSNLKLVVNEEGW